LRGVPLSVENVRPGAGPIHASDSRDTPFISVACCLFLASAEF